MTTPPTPRAHTFARLIQELELDRATWWFAEGEVTPDQAPAAVQGGADDLLRLVVVTFDLPSNAYSAHGMETVEDVRREVAQHIVSRSAYVVAVLDLDAGRPMVLQVFAHLT